MPTQNSSERYTRSPSLGAKATIVGLIGITGFGVFDQLRSIGQNTAAESLGDHARTVLVMDYNPWEQSKDYLAPQDSSRAVQVDSHDSQPRMPDAQVGLPEAYVGVPIAVENNNEDRAPLFDPERRVDYGHLLLVTELALVGAGTVILYASSKD